MARQLRAYPPATRARARFLRQQGRTHAEICAQLGDIPQATLSYWLRGISLNALQQQRIQAKIIASAARGRPLALAAWTRKIVRWQKTIRARVKMFSTWPYADEKLGKLVLGIMYFCEGAKYPSSRHLIFGNTDPHVLRAFLALLRRHYPIDERRLRARVMHRWDQEGVVLQKYWSRVIGIPVRQFYRSYADRRTKDSPTLRRNYRGVCAVEYGNTNIQYELQAIAEAVWRMKDGGADGDRTRDLLRATQALSQAELLPQDTVERNGVST